MSETVDTTKVGNSASLAPTAPSTVPAENTNPATDGPASSPATVAAPGAGQRGRTASAHHRDRVGTSTAAASRAAGRPRVAGTVTPSEAAAAAKAPEGGDVAGDRDAGPVPEQVWAVLLTRPGSTAAELAATADVGRSTVSKLLATWASEGTATSIPGATARAARRWTATPDNARPTPRPRRRHVRPRASERSTLTPPARQPKPPPRPAGRRRNSPAPTPSTTPHQACSRQTAPPAGRVEGPWRTPRLTARRRARPPASLTPGPRRARRRLARGCRARTTGARPGWQLGSCGAWSRSTWPSTRGPMDRSRSGTRWGTPQVLSPMPWNDSSRPGGQNGPASGPSGTNSPTPTPTPTRPDADSDTDRRPGRR